MVLETHPLRIVRTYCVLCQLLGPHSSNMTLNKLLFIPQSPTLINHSFSAFPCKASSLCSPVLCSDPSRVFSSRAVCFLSFSTPLLYSTLCVGATRTPRYSFLSASSLVAQQGSLESSQLADASRLLHYLPPGSSSFVTPSSFVPASTLTATVPTGMQGPGGESHILYPRT